MMTPRFRADLKATPVEDADGVLYYDVSDPKTGNVLRLFDFEWELAQRIDGKHSLDELVGWTEEHLGFSTSRADLETYAERLHQLGYLDLGPAGAAPVAARPAAKPEPAPVAPVPVQAQAQVPVQAPPVQAPVAQAAPPPAVATPPEPAMMPQRAVERSTPEPARPAAAAPEKGDKDDDDGLMGRPVITLPKAAQQSKPVPVVESKPAAESKPTPAKAAEPKAAKPAEPAAKGHVKLVGAPGPMSSALQEALEGLPEPAAVPAEAQAAKPAPEPAPAAGVMSAVQAALAETAPKPPEAKSEPLASAATPVTAAKPAAEAPKPAPVAAAAPAPAAEAKPAAKPPEAATPAKPPVIEVEVKKAPKPPVAAEPASQGGGAGKWIVILLVLGLLGAAAYYFMVLRPKWNPPPLGVQVSAAKVEDVPRSFPAPVEVKKSEPQPVKVESDGTVAKIAAENDEVTSETVLVVLDTKAKLEKELAEVRVRSEQFQKKLETAKGKLKQEAQTKLDEKQARIAEVEALIKKTQVLGARPGTVAKVLTKVGDAVTAGTEVVTVADKALAAEIKVPALESQGMKIGQEVKLFGGAVPSSAPITAQLVSMKTEGELSTLVFSLPASAEAVKPGDKLSLQRGMAEKVVRLPSSAVVEGNKVYMIQAGKAAILPVTVVDRDGDSVLVQGLNNGDQIILTHSPELHEGVAVQPAAPPSPAPPS